MAYQDSTETTYLKLIYEELVKNNETQDLILHYTKLNSDILKGIDRNTALTYRCVDIINSKTRG